MKSVSTNARRHFLWLALVVPLVAFALACGAAEAPTPTATKAVVAAPTATAVATPTPTPVGGVPKRGGQFRQIANSLPSNWDITQGCCPDIITTDKMFLSVLYEPQGSAGPVDCDLCDTWELRNSGKTIYLHLRGDATFHDGTPIKAQDIKYSLEKITGKVGGVVNVRNGYMKEYIDSMETPDDKTLLINMKRPSPLMLRALSLGMSGIVPAGATRADYQDPPLGPKNRLTNGPYYLKEFVADSHALFERNPNYFKKGADGKALPYLDSIKVSAFADLSAGATALLTGAGDAHIELGSRIPVQFWPQLNKLEKAGKMAQVERPFFLMSAAWFNFNLPLWQDIKMRQVMNLAVDRKEYGDVKYSGDYLPATYFPPGTPFGRPENEIWDVIPGFGTGANKKAEQAQAKKLMAEAGYPNGFKLSMLSSSWDALNNEAMQRNYKTIGIDASLNLPSNVNALLSTKEYTFYIFRAATGSGDPDEVFAQYFLPGGGRSWSAYENSGAGALEIQRLYPLMSSELDLVKRKQLVRQMEDILMKDEASVLGVDSFYRWWYYTAKLHGFNPGSTLYYDSTHRGESWWME